RKTIKDTKGAVTTLVGPGGETNWTSIPSTPPVGQTTLVPVNAPLLTAAATTDAQGNITTTQPWHLRDGYLRADIRGADGSSAAVPREWRELGFPRGLTPPSAGVPNAVHPNAVLILQMQAGRN